MSNGYPPPKASSTGIFQADRDGASAEPGSTDAESHLEELAKVRQTVRQMADVQRTPPLQEADSLLKNLTVKVIPEIRANSLPVVAEDAKSEKTTTNTGGPRMGG
jgi:hypothetical protein